VLVVVCHAAVTELHLEDSAQLVGVARVYSFHNGGLQRLAEALDGDFGTRLGVGLHEESLPRVEVGYNGEPVLVLPCIAALVGLGMHSPDDAGLGDADDSAGPALTASHPLATLQLEAARRDGLVNAMIPEIENGEVFHMETLLSFVETHKDVLDFVGHGDHAVSPYLLELGLQDELDHDELVCTELIHDHRRGTW
jgi:hypothetical protein